MQKRVLFGRRLASPNGDIECLIARETMGTQGHPTTGDHISQMTASRSMKQEKLCDGEAAAGRHAGGSGVYVCVRDLGRRSGLSHHLRQARGGPQADVGKISPSVALLCLLLC